jgi:hypothetical protein
MSTTFTDAEIAAFMAGRLTGRDADRIAAALESDPAAQAAAERLALPEPETDRLLREAFAAPLAEPVPAPLAAAVLGASGKVATLRRPATGGPGQSGRGGWVPAALAASLALAVGLGTGFGLRAPAPAVAALSVGAADAAVAAALGTARSGTAAGTLRPTATFLDATGRPCREFDTLDATGTVTGSGVACRGAEAGWHVLMLAAAVEPGAPSAGFAPASGDAADPLPGFLDALGAGAALSPDAEAALIARGWR